MRTGRMLSFMEPRRFERRSSHRKEREPLEREILALRLSLTAAWAHAQLLERRARQGVVSTPGAVERSSGMISAACDAMSRAILRMEDALEKGGSRPMPLTSEYEPSPSAWAREQAETFEASNGTKANTLQGRPIVLMTSVGAKSGKLRKTPLMRVEHEGEYAAVASKGGAPTHPEWYWNLRKNPHVELQDGPVKRDYLAREVSGEERAIWWERAVEAYPPYAEYQEKTSREIPVFVLTPMDDD